MKRGPSSDIDIEIDGERSLKKARANDGAATEVTPERAAAVTGLAWAGFSLGLGSAPLTLYTLIGTPALTTAFSYAFIKAGNSIFNGTKKLYQSILPNTTETQPQNEPVLQLEEAVEEKEKEKETEPVKTAKQLAHELQALIGEEKKNKTSFEIFRKFSKQVEKGEQREKVWHYAHKSLVKMKDLTKQSEIAKVKRHYEAKLNPERFQK